MLNKNAKKWVKALRSGKYKQIDGQLTQVDEKGKALGYCCLGVACDLAIKAGVKLKITDISDERSYDGHSGLLPEKVKKWLGLDSVQGQFFDRWDFDRDLVDLNDNGKSFKYIARIIESEPKGLFKRSSK